MGSCISEGNNVIPGFWYLGKGEDESNTKLKLFTFVLFTLNVIIIKKYSDSMRFSSIFSWKLRIIPYLHVCETGTKHLYLLLVLIQIYKIRTWCQNLYHLQQNEYFCHLIPLIIQNYPHILQKRRLKTGSYVLYTRGSSSPIMRVMQRERDYLFSMPRSIKAM